MDKIWDRKSEAVVAGIYKTNDHAETTKIESKKNNLHTIACKIKEMCII